METSRTCNGPHTWSRITSTATCLCLILLSYHSASAAPLRAPSASPTSITLTWTAPGDDTTDGQASQYDLRYSLAPITEVNWGSATTVAGEPSPAVSGSLETFTVTGLTPGTTYYFAIKAADEIPNWSALSNVVSAATDPEATPPATVADLSGSNITPTTLNLTWTAPGDDGSSGTATTYDIRYATSLTVLQNWTTATQLTGEPAPAIAGTQQSYTVTGLNPSTTYYFALRAADEVPNWSASSNTVTATTLPEQNAPASVINLVTSSPTTSAVTLSWTAPGDDGNTGTAATYDIRYSTALITAANFASALQVTGEPSPKSAGSSES